MPNTFNDMVNEVKNKLAGYTLKQDRITYLSSAIDNAVSVITIGSSDNLAKGIIEIDDELIYIDSFNTNTNTLNCIPGYGRGFQGTPAIAHANGALVVMTPNFPRQLVKQAINDTINAAYPKLFSVKHSTFTFSSVVTSYALPTDMIQFISASWQQVGPSKQWQLLRRYRIDAMANQSTWGTSNTLNIYDAIPSGRTVDVAYAGYAAPFTANTDDFTAVVGLPPSCWDVIVLGACSRLLAFIDAGRINMTSAESDLADSKIPSSAGQTLGKFVYALFQQRLNEEAAKMQGQYRFSPHYIN